MVIFVLTLCDNLPFAKTKYAKLFVCVTWMVSFAILLYMSVFVNFLSYFLLLYVRMFIMFNYRLACLCFYIV